MKKIFKGSLATMLAIIMALSSAVYAIAASVDTDFTLEIKSVTKHFAGMTYTVTATLRNLTEEELTQEEFTWGIDETSQSSGGSIGSISTLNTISGDTYTVSQTASLKLPDSTGTTTVTATFGEYTKTLDVTRLEPIRHIDIASPQTDNRDYYFTSDGTLYLNAAKGTDTNNESTYSPAAELTYSCNETPDDSVDTSIIGNNDDYYYKEDTMGESKIRIGFTSMDTQETSDLVLRSTPSGRTESVIKLVECTPAQYTNLLINNNMIYNGKEKLKENIFVTSANVYTGTSYTISTKDTYPRSANDRFEYTLYNDDQSKQLDCYSIDENGDCILNLPDSGNYVLKCTAVSKGGYLPRDYELTVNLNAAKPNYISGIALKQVDESGAFLEEDFNGTTLYKGSSQAENNKYNLKKHVKIANTTNYSAEDAIMYESSDENVATVDENGVVTAIGSGTATITVYSKMGVDEHSNKTIFDTCDFRVYQLVDSIDIASPSATLPQGHTIRLQTVVSPADHDETVSWGLSATTPDSNGNYPLTIDQNGQVTANAQYEFGDQTEISVDVIATARLTGTEIGETSAKYTIRVIPSVNTKFLQITARQDNYGFLVENAAGTFSDSNVQYQDDESGNTNISYNGDTFTLNSAGYDNINTATANRSTDVYKWTVAYSGKGTTFGEEMSIEDATNGTESNPNQYFKSSQYTESTDTYSITPQINGVYRFTSYAVNRGDGIEKAKATNTFTVKVVYKAKSISFSTRRTTLPTGESITVKTNLDSSDAYKYDEVMYTSVNSTVATVAKAEDYDTSYKVIITAGSISTPNFADAIQATTRSGLTTYFSLRVTENIKNAYVEFVDPNEYIYDGTAKTPNINVYVGDGEGENRLLVKGTDYDLIYTDNVNAGVASIEIKGKNSLAESSTFVHFNINTKVIGDGKTISDYLTQGQINNFYDITPTNPTPVPGITILDTERNNAKLGADRDYTVTAINNTTAGVATATVTGIGNYEGSYTFDYNVRDYINNATVQKIEDQVFTGKAIEPKITVSYVKQVKNENNEIEPVNWPMVEGKDYTVSYRNNVNVGEATVIIKGIEPGFKDTKEVHFNITKADISSANHTCQVNATSYQKNENVVAPLPTLTVYDADRNIQLKQTTNAEAIGNCFIVTAVNNLSSGTATATVTGIGNYKGSFETTYEVSDNINNAVCDAIPDQVYTGSQITPDIRLTYTQKVWNGESGYEDVAYELIKDTDYTVSYQNNTASGTATITVNGKGNHFYGRKTINFNIIPVEIQSAEPTTNVLFVTDASTKNKPNYGLLEKDGSTYAYTNDSMTLLGIGTDSNGNNTNNKYSWQVTLEDGTVVDMQQPTSSTNLSVNGTVYFEYRYNNNNSVYTIIPRLKGEYVFKCTAVDSNGNTASATKAITVVDSGSISFVDVSETVIPVNGKVKATLRFNCLDGYRYNSCTFTTDNYNVATVEKDADYDTTYGITVTAKEKTGTATITAETRNGIKASFRIVVKNDIASAQISGIEASYPYTGEIIQPEPALTFYGMPLTKGVDYRLEYRDNLNAGTATLTIIGQGNDFAGRAVIPYTIKAMSIPSISSLNITVRDAFYSIHQNNPAPVPNLTVTYTNSRGTVTLRKDVDYTVTCSSNTKSGTAKAKITGKGNYSGYKVVSYKVCDSITKASIASIASQSYSGTLKTPAIKVTYKGTTLKKGVDYNVRYANNLNIGTATVFIDGINPKFYGTHSRTFKIVPKRVTNLRTVSRTSSSVKLAWKKDPTATGYQIYDVLAKKVVKRIDNNATYSYKKTGLTAGKEYRYKVRSYTNVSGVNYYGSYSAILYTYTTPKIPALKLTTSKKSVKASWSKVSGVGGYQIQRSTKSSFKGASTTTLSSRTTSKKYTKLTKGKIYYVRIRSYKNIKVNGKSKKVYSAWKTAKIKCK